MRELSLTIIFTCIKTKQMPRQSMLSTPSRKKQKGWYSEQMKAAINTARQKATGYKKAVKMYSVLRSTLKQLVKDPQKSLELLVHIPLRRKPVLPADLEKS
ncbi:hypothetical protein EVAR_75617_1 [Eumeta japonica]|uniref:Uncharacterized protein n=1 Tax=Eumeta variegata TaxID=151549 RepID=A0A4C1TZZ7_EUMVA|nr:hypothetical protein EVAR_75617_1 [Eumeta japonica]